MTAPSLYAFVGALLFLVGLYGALARRHLVRKILAVNLMASGTFLLLIALPATAAAGPPDPAPRAMVLTGIVVAVSATAFALALARRVRAEQGRPLLPGDASEAAQGPTDDR